MKKSPPKAKAEAAKTTKRKVKVEDAAGYRIEEPVLDPIGDVSSGEGRTYLGTEPETHVEAGIGAFHAETAAEAPAEDTAVQERVAEGAAPLPPARLERLQKILSQAGIASRRHAEEMIAAGRVMVNGQVVTQLGSKADPARDHIRVDDKLLHGAERKRYFLLNKPKGYVTTVSDPEGRPTVMQFFAKMNERLYPVGRLDFQSEGLLLMSNDGELANLLARAGSGVEKTYLVKVAGQPTEEELERLRKGVEIERGEEGSARVRTAPALVRQVREGDNPWFEVVLIEGRNRELRKMFAAIGHFAEKIRRVGYGPLVLDVEPGNFRELTPEEVNALRLTAEGKMKPRRVRTDLPPPKKAGHGAERREGPAGKRFVKPAGRGGRPLERRGEKGGFGQRSGSTFGAKPGFSRPAFKPSGERKFGEGEERGAFRRTENRGFGQRPGATFGAKPKFGRPAFQPAGERKFGEGVERGSFPRGEKGGFGKRPGSTFGARPKFGRPAFPNRERRESNKPGFERTKRRPFQQRGERPGPGFGETNRRPFQPRGEQTKLPSEATGPKPFQPHGERPAFVPGKRPDWKPRGEGKKPFAGGRGKNFGAKPKFGGKPSGFGKPRGAGERGGKSGFSRPGAQRGGWKRRG